MGVSSSRAFLLGLVFMLSGLPAQSATKLVLQSEPGDYIGMGQVRSFTSEELDFYPSISLDGNSVSFWMSNFNRPYQYPIWWSVNLSAPAGQRLAVGTYADARRSPFASGAAGLDVYGEGRGCNTLTGRFTILELVLDPVSQGIVRFAADFEQHCEDGPAALLGAIRYNSDVPVNIKVPPKINVLSPLNYRGCVEATSAAGGTVKLSAIASSEDTSYAFSWSSTTGITGTGKTFDVPVGLNQTAVVTLNQQDLATGDVQTVTRTVCSADTTPPTVRIISPAYGATVVSRAFQLEVEVTDAVDQQIPNYEMYVGRSGFVQMTGKTGRTLVPNPIATSDLSMTYIDIRAQDSSGNTGYAFTAVTLAKDASAKKN